MEYDTFFSLFFFLLFSLRYLCENLCGCEWIIMNNHTNNDYFGTFVTELLIVHCIIRYLYRSRDLYDQVTTNINYFLRRFVALNWLGLEDWVEDLVYLQGT